MYVYSSKNEFKLNLIICDYFVSGKHPVSLLGEYCTKKKLGAPVYELCFESGPDHRKNFLFKVSNVIINNLIFILSRCVCVCVCVYVCVFIHIYLIYYR